MGRSSNLKFQSYMMNDHEDEDANFFDAKGDE